MKLTLVIAVSSLFSLALATPLKTASQEQAQAATPPGPSQFQLWKDPGKLEDLKDVLFDFDTHESPSEHATLEANARWLRDHPDVRFRLAAYADVRGTIAYNLVLSQKRADTVKHELIQMGIAENRIQYATGWGELYPNCLESTEQCWTRQRRVEFVRPTDESLPRSGTGE